MSDRAHGRTSRKEKYRQTEEATIGQVRGRRPDCRKPKAERAERVFGSGACLHKKIRCLSSGERATEREKARAVKELRQTYQFNTLLKISALARSTFYYHLKEGRTDKYREAKKEITEVFTENDGRYGYRRITDELHAKGIKLNHKTVLKLMRSLNIHGKMRKSEQYHSYKGEVGKVADDLLKRDFNATEPFKKLATDVTQFKVKETRVYLSPIMDLYNNEIVAYSISLRPDLAQTREMLEELSKRLPKRARPILHSDQGWQYQHAMYQRYLEEHQITQSMSRKGNCMDNGAMECFFGRLKVEMYYGEKFESAEDLIEKLHRYIYYWNNKRISRRLKAMSPVGYRTHCQTI